ncbi:hypothetical protein GJAV_G00031890 [Gymnothorax javanicus]|nr:hypothetical protein GJAV_G00031890 [Gymnothorax javanicus]
MVNQHLSHEGILGIALYILAALAGRPAPTHPHPAMWNSPRKGPHFRTQSCVWLTLHTPSIMHLLQSISINLAKPIYGPVLLLNLETSTCHIVQPKPKFLSPLPRVMEKYRLW